MGKEKTLKKKEVNSLSASSNQFTAELYKTLCNASSASLGTKNLVFSGFSIHIVLGMAAIGARSQTRQEMIQGLCLNDSESNDIIGGKYFTAVNGFGAGSRPDYFTVSLASKIYCSEKLELNPTYEAAVRTHFKLDVERLNMANKEAAAKKVNDWVAAKTKQKIQQIVTSKSFSEDTGLVLVNTIYFKGNWEHPFDPSNTQEMLFNLSSKKTVDVEMMFTEQTYDYADLQDIKAQAIRIPYRGRRFSMIIILPEDPDTGLTAVQKWTFHKNGKSQVLEKLATREDVLLTLPRFKIEVTLDNIADSLESMGMKTMLSAEKANFSGIASQNSSNPDVYISSVIQKAVIEVDEKGAEAAAATKTDMRRGRSGPVPDFLWFTVDRPFYFEIVDHSQENRVLFAGHCIDPTLNK